MTAHPPETEMPAQTGVYHVDVQGAPDVIFAPSASDIDRSGMTAFTRFCARRAGRVFPDYAALHQFSVAHPAEFWGLLLEWAPFATSGDRQPALVGAGIEDATFFPGLRISYVQTLLRDIAPDNAFLPAVTAIDERGHTERLTRGELADRVLAAARGLRALGVTPGDRVAAVASNRAESIVACLASVALGATWSAVAPDLGVDAIVDRFRQIEPAFLFYHDRYDANGVTHDISEQITQAARALPGLHAAIALGPVPARPPCGMPVLTLADVVASGLASAHGPRSLDELEHFPWNHPLFVLFSSGTTGRPKCIVHGAGGTLIKHYCEHALHSGFGRGDKLLFHTTCSWMMWNWQLSALACGTELVVYDGSVAYPEPDSLWTLVARERVTVFGTSPAFLRFSRDQRLRLTPLDFGALRAIQSTGAVLPDSLFSWVTDAIRPMPVQSISGGTDIIGCFLLGNPNLPVVRGELQCVALGMDVRVFDRDEHNVGELVCASPFPSRPVGLYGDNDGGLFHNAYFAAHPGVWTHGDLVEMTASGGARVHGRSDGVLNIAGVRIGPAELYRIVDELVGVAASMALEQQFSAELGGSRLVLLVVTQDGCVLDAAMETAIRQELRRRCSPAHVPSVIAEVAELPTTHSGKRSERAATEAVNGRPVHNRAALRNPECLDVLASHPRLRLPSECAPPSPSAHASDVPEDLEALHLALATLWQSALGRMPAGYDQDFFSLGGNSLAGVGLLGQVEATFGRRLPMSALLGPAGTIAGMADALRRRDTARSSLVTIRGTGTRPAVYWVPGGGGMSVVGFRDVSERLGPDQPVYGLEAPASEAEAPRSIQDKARRYVELLRQQHPGRPYRLLGFSLGAFTALEMAVQLCAGGDAVDKLVVFDTPVPTVRGPLDRLRAMTQRGSYHAARLRRLSPAGYLEYAAYLHQIARVRGRRFLSMRKLEPGAPKTGPGEHDTFERLDLQNRAIALRYAAGELPVFPGRIAVVLCQRSSRSALSADLDDRLAWRRLAGGGLDVYEVDGGHEGVLREPELSRLVPILQNILAS